MIDLADFLQRIRFDPSGCWVWTGGTKGPGYGCYKRGYAHRVSYQVFVGEIPEGKVMDHLCRNRICVNPDHLEPVTMGENTKRGTSPPAVNATKTHCLRGHELSGENLFMAQGRRHCRQCHRIRGALYHARKAGGS